MSRLVVLLFLLVNVMSFAQDEDAWRDSLLLARKAYESEDYAKALKYYESAQKSAPDDIDLSDEMAQSAYRSRDFERAEKIYRQGRGTKMSKSDRGDALHNIGNSQMRQKKYEDAIESYKEALRNNPNDEETRYNLSKAIRKLKEQQPPPQQNNNQNNQNSDKGDKGKQEQNGQQGDQSNGKNQDSKGSQGKQSNGQKKPNNSSSGGGSSDDSSQGKLSNQMVERTLDKLAKKEGETKRKMMGAGAGGRSAKSGKDW